MKELQSIGLDINVLDAAGKKINIDDAEEDDEIVEKARRLELDNEGHDPTSGMQPEHKSDDDYNEDEQYSSGDDSDEAGIIADLGNMGDLGSSDDSDSE